MMDNAGQERPLSRNPRLVPPDEHADALLEAEIVAKKPGRWNDQQTTHVFLRVWAAVIDEIGHYQPYSSDEYQHRLSYRILLHRVLVALQDNRNLEALYWLQSEVDRLDQIFLERSTNDVESLIYRKEKTNPSFWFLRRLPNDRNIVNHLRTIQPKS